MMTFVVSAIPVGMAYAEHLTITGSSDEEFFCCCTIGWKVSQIKMTSDDMAYPGILKSGLDGDVEDLLNAARRVHLDRHRLGNMELSHYATLICLNTW